MRTWKLITVFADGRTELTDFQWNNLEDFSRQVDDALANHMADGECHKIDTIILQPVGEIGV